MVRGEMTVTRLYDTPLMCEPIDISKEFGKLENIYFLGMKTSDFHAEEASGKIRYERHARKPRFDFDKYTMPLGKTESWEFPPQYVESPELPFSLSFVNSRTVRVRLSTKATDLPERESIMLVSSEIKGDLWEIVEQNEQRSVYRSEHGSVTVMHDPWGLEFRDAAGRLLTRTKSPNEHKSPSVMSDFCFVRSVADMKHYISASFQLSPGEKIFGSGESFMKLDKRGQKLNWFTFDPLSAQTADMYKPIPFFFSSRGYGMFFHSSSPMTADFGNSNDSSNTIFVGDDELDLFFFFGDPKDVISAYTGLTGRSEVPPLWSFGLWMSRITYKAEDEVREVAAKLREHRIPCDVIHLDTGWFEEDWRCNYLFSETRFPDAARMMADLREDGFRVSLWQYPYFLPSNELYEEIVREGLAVYDGDGKLASLDAVLDFSNPRAVAWYKEKIAGLLRMGISAIKADFGESAPVKGQYASGRSGWFEHNLYPLRYNQAVSEITKEITGDSIIWGRSAWAGSQRYPLHWGGDSENTDCSMAATLRAGLSFGMSGFSFWSHDIGGFWWKSPRELYRRWLPFGMLTSHSRCHGAPPKEPWHYDEEFTCEFQRAVELKYKLMPYIYTQAVSSAAGGFPLLRPLFFEYPEDPGSWLIEDQYLFGSDMLVAPLMEENQNSRDLYLPPGVWIDYQTSDRYEGARWHHIEAGEIPIVLLVKEGSCIPHAPLAQSTANMDWSQLTWQLYGNAPERFAGQVSIPVNGSSVTIQTEFDAVSLKITSMDKSIATSGWTFRQIAPN